MQAKPVGSVGISWVPGPRRARVSLFLSDPELVQHQRAVNYKAPRPIPLQSSAAGALSAARQQSGEACE